MKPIQLLYVKNIISRRNGAVRQDLAFFILVEHLAYEKHVEVVWAGENDVWQTLHATYDRSVGQHQEVWLAQVSFELSSEVSLPGNIQFALRYRVLDLEFWDNNASKNYAIDADSGIRVQEGFPLLNLEYQQTLRHGQKFYPITVAVHRALCPQQVYVHWTTDHWKHVRTTPCFFKRKHWDKALWSNVRNPNRYGCEIWISHLQIDDAYRVEYAVACETLCRKIWDNNFGRNYVARRDRLKVLTLNLHCYQEEQQDSKFTQIAKAINDLQIDVVCLQEVGEHWNNGKGDWKSNAANIIRRRLKKPYHLYTDWSHIGFSAYREGSAILSRYPLQMKDSKYVSPCRDPYSIHSRKVVMAQINVPCIGPVNIFSSHLSWWRDGFRDQFENLRAWANHHHSPQVTATLLCGDFNTKAGSEGYTWIAKTGEYRDQFLKATCPDIFEKISGHVPQQWTHYLANDHRIDYVFMKTDGHLEATFARPLFTEHDYGRVSDHYGYYVEFELKYP